MYPYLIPLELKLDAVIVYSRVVRELIHYNAALMRCKDVRGRTPLHTACLWGKAKVVKLYTSNLEHGVSSLKIADSMGNTPLHLACNCTGGNRDTVQHLINCGVTVDGMNMKGEAPIHIAAQHGFTSIVEVLLDSKVDIELQSEEDMCTPLHHAAKSNQEEMIKFLLQRGLVGKYNNYLF